MDGSNNSEEISQTPPKIHCTLPPLLLKQSHPASIPIKVTGRPSPRLEWLVKGVSADQSPGCKVSTGPGRRSHPDEILTVLEISSVDQTLEGGIELVAVNDQGTDRFVVPLKTYRLLTGIYLEEEKEQKGMKTKGYEGTRTIDRRLFHNEVDEACKGIKIYQAYRNISKSYDNCNDVVHSDRGEDPAMRRWKQEMAKRNLMKSIDDIIDNFDSEECPGEQEKLDPFKVRPAGNSSFRSVNVPHTNGASNIMQASSKAFSAGKDRLRTQTLNLPRAVKKTGRMVIPGSPPKKLIQECSKSGDEVFSFCGQRLSEFCEKLLHDESKSGDLMSKDQTDRSNPNSTFPFHTQIIKCDTTENKPPADNFCIENGDDENLNHLHQRRSSVGNKIYEEISIEEPDLTEKIVESNPKSQCTSDQTGIELSGTGKGELVAFEGDLSSEIEMIKLNKSGKSRREELINILSDLNDQLEKWELEKGRHERELPRPDSGKSQTRNYQCKSENLEECSVTEISEYSKSLNELTEKLTTFESGRSIQEPPKSFLRPLRENLETGTEKKESICSVELKNPSFKYKSGLVKPHIAKKENRPKPAVPPKPKFMKDRRRACFSSDVFQATINFNEIESENLEASDCNSRYSDARNDSLLHDNLLVRVSKSSSSLDYQSSSLFSTPSPSSSSTSQSFTPSPSPASSRTLAAFPPSPESPPARYESPSSISRDSSFTLSPPSPHHQSTTFSSTKYKLVRPPAPLSLSETPSSLSPLSSTSSSPLFLSPQLPPSSCPASVELGRKKIDKVWIPSPVNKSFKVYKISSRGKKSPFGRHLREDPASGMTGSAGNVSNLQKMESDPLGRSASTRSVEILPERRDSYASMEKYRALNNSRRALSKRYELVTITTKEETVTLKNVDGSKFRRKSLGKTTISNPPESLNAAERLYYLLGGVKEKDEDGNDDDRDRDKLELPEGTEMLRVEAYRLPRDQKVKEENKESGCSYEGLVSSLMSLAKDSNDEELK